MSYDCEQAENKPKAVEEWRGTAENVSVRQIQTIANETGIIDDIARCQVNTSVFCLGFYGGRRTDVSSSLLLDFLLTHL